MKNKVLYRHFSGKIKTVDKDEHIVEVGVSDDTRDRYNEVIEHGAWRGGLDNYKKHPVLMSSHGWAAGGLKNIIGEAKNIRVDKEEGLIANFSYFVGKGNEEADWAWFLVEQGIAAFSVGFLPKKAIIPEEKEGEDLPARIYKEVELLEVSQVEIPANPSCVQAGIEAGAISKSFGKKLLEAFENEPIPVEILEADTSGVDEILEKVDSLVKRIENMNGIFVKALNTLTDMVKGIDEKVVLKPGDEPPKVEDKSDEPNPESTGTVNEPAVEIRVDTVEEVKSLLSDGAKRILRKKFGVM